MKKVLSIAAALMAVLAISASCKKETPKEAATISATPNTVDFTLDGGSVNVAITTNQDTFTFSGQDSWLTVTANGKSLTLTAATNLTTSERRCTISLKADDATATIEVVQAKGSKHPGYNETTTAQASYFGTMLSKFYKMPDADGGYANITMMTEDSTRISIEFYTELYKTADEVALVAGTYAKGTDNPSASSYIGKKMTFIPGGKYTVDDEDFYAGSMMISPKGANTLISDGTFTLSQNTDGTYAVLTDFKDADGNDIKYFFDGKLAFDASEASYPGEAKPDPTKVTSASASFLGCTHDSSAVEIQLMLACEDNSPMTVITFNMPYAEYDSLMVLSGTYMTGEGDNTYAAGTADKGSLVDYGTFSLPAGSYVMYSFGDYMIADSMASLILAKNADGTYSITAMLMNKSETSYMYSISSIAIPLSDGRDSGGGD